MKTILIPTDFSKAASNAMKYAFGLAEKTNSRIIVLHAFSIPTADINIPFTGIYNFQHEAVDQAQQEMNTLIRTYKRLYPGVKVKPVLAAGIPSAVISGFIRDNKIKTVVMGTTGQGAVTRALIGSTTSSVIKHAACDVIAVPPRVKFNGIDSIAFAIDFENDNITSVREVVSYARTLGARVMFVHVQDLEFFDEKDRYTNMSILVREQTNYRDISFHIIRNSDIAQGLDRFVRKNKPDMLVMATHKRNFPGSIFKPSLSRKMSYHTSIPLLVLHLPSNMPAHDKSQSGS